MNEVFHISFVISAAIINALRKLIWTALLIVAVWRVIPFFALVFQVFSMILGTFFVRPFFRWNAANAGWPCALFFAGRRCLSDSLSTTLLIVCNSYLYVIIPFNRGLIFHLKTGYNTLITLSVARAPIWITDSRDKSSGLMVQRLKFALNFEPMNPEP